MKLTKLEMYGFKSFARKTEIQFEDGITAIIGPNGSGKSNISDAVRWVLGEQSAKALRGSKMEDVIFNGTEQRKAVAYCEVSLTFDNSDHELLTEYEEVCIARRMYRSGESEYFINRASCRRKDIADLFRDTGVGRDGYSVIGQGKVEEILSNKSQDRRNAFEEAAGVMKYRVRKEEAERKLENTRSNIERLRDILDELERQVGPLEEQSRAAREYLRLREELRELEVNVFLYQYDKLNERLKTLAEAASQLEDEIALKQGLDAELATLSASEEEKERSLGGAISELNAKLLSLTSGVEAHTGESKVFGERLSGLIKDRERAEKELGENEARIAELSSERLSREASLDEKRAEHDRLQKEYEAESDALLKMDRSIAEKDELLEKRKTELIDAMNRLSDAKIIISRFETIRGTLDENIAGIEKRKLGLADNCKKLDEEYEEERRRFDALTSERDACSAEKNAAILKLNETNQKLREAREAVRRAEQLSEAGRSRLKVLEEMKRAHEGYYASVQNILRDCERDAELKRSVEGVVAELIRVPSEYETAIEMALGAALQNIVTKTEDDAKRVIEHLRARKYGRATFLPIAAMRPRLLDQRELSFCRVKGFIGVASELVGFDEKYRGVFENMLGRTVIVEDLDAGIAINRQAHNSFRIATIKGDIINPGGSMTGGSVQKREFSIVGREREIEELKKRNLELMEEQRVRALEADTLERGLGDANDAVALSSDALHAKELELATHSEKLSIIRDYCEDAKNELIEADNEISRLRDDIENIDSQFNNAQRDSTELESGNTATQSEIKAEQEALYALRAEYARRSDSVSDMRVAAANAEKECASAEGELNRLQKEIARLSELSERDRLSINEYQSNLEKITNDMRSIEGNIEIERKEVDALADRLHAMEEERAKHMRALDEARARRELVSSELSELNERKHRNELNRSRSEMELSTMQDRIWEDYELTYENAEPMRRQIAITSSHARVGEIKAEIKELGDVNVNSIEDYKSVKERYESLAVQYEDLVKAEADLRQLIAELVSTMENEFSRQFAMIQENFAEVFVELFGGGQAELILSDKNDILNCNIDIVAQPPGKKLQLLSLLSGGERALTAIALLFAILKLKPTAFCILDEIETSLDEVNVSTVAQYLKKYSNKTQFIMITHRKGSMEVCNALYGVAMEEKGISKVVSARFNQ